MSIQAREELSPGSALAQYEPHLLRVTAVFGALIAVPLLIFYFRVLSGSADYFISDHSFYFQPFAHYLGERLRHGELPLWNPYLYCGMSQIAIPSPGVFYPPNWLFACLQYSQGVAAIMLLHQIIAAVGCFLLIASFGWGVLPAAVCGIVYAFSGYMFTLLQNYTLATSAAWLPLMLWAFRQIVNVSAEKRENDNELVHKTHGLVCLASLSLFCMIACGRPEISIPGLALLCAFIAIDYRRAIAGGAIKWQIVSIMIAGLLSTLVVLPTVEWVSLSARAKGLNLSQVLMWSTNWYDFIGMFFLEPFGDPPTAWF